MRETSFGWWLTWPLGGHILWLNQYQLHVRVDPTQLSGGIRALFALVEHSINLARVTVPKFRNPRLFDLAAITDFVLCPIGWDKLLWNVLSSLLGGNPFRPNLVSASAALAAESIPAALHGEEAHRIHGLYLLARRASL